MNKSVSSVDEYIAGFDANAQKVLQQVRGVIQEAAPPETIETISYQMPTYRYNGNLIHFAHFKNHLGLYPGPAAITAFADALKPYKTFKGTIQIPLDEPLPTQLISEIVVFNVDLLKDKKSPKWDTYRANWIECEEIMNQLIAKTTLKKEFKWGMNIYTYNGKNVIGWAGFKHFFSLWFYNGVFLENKEKVLVTASDGKTKALRQWRFTDVKEMDEKKILAYVLESIQTIKDGKEIKPEKATSHGPDGILKEAIDNNNTLKKAFEALTPGKQREYIAYIAEAKQDKTKVVRMDKIAPLILAGKGLNDKYKKHS